MKGAVQMELEPLTTIPATPSGVLKPQPVAAKVSISEKAEPLEMTGKETLAASARPAVAVVTPVSSRTTIASIEPNVQRKRDDERRKILENELSQEEQSLNALRGSIIQEQQNPTLVAAVRAAQQAESPSPTQMVEMRNALDKASGRIRGLQATAAEHEKNIEALKKELGALKP
jgi:hypothetical protein